MSVYLHSLATALPPHCLTQKEVQDRASRIFGQKYRQFDRLYRTFQTAGIEKRYSVVPLDWFSNPHGWSERNAAFMVGAKALFVDAAKSALDNANWLTRDVDCVVTVSSTGIATPSLEAQVFTEMGFRDNIMRIPVFGLAARGGSRGCPLPRPWPRDAPDQKFCSSL